MGENLSVRLKIEPVELGPCQAMVYDRGARSWAIVLPGANYSSQAPVLWYARRAALTAGRSVLAVTDTWGQAGGDAAAWVDERVEAALDHVRRQDAQPVVIGKSLTSLAARLTARERLPAVWLTPLIGAGGTEVSSVVRAALREATAPMLLVGGTGDAAWDGEFASSLPNATVLELPGADHVLEAPDDVAKSLNYLTSVAETISRFLVELD